MPTIVAEGWSARRRIGRAGGGAGIGGAATAVATIVRSAASEALLDAGHGRSERVDREPRLGAEVARRLRLDAGGEAALVGNCAFEHDSLRFAEIERVPPAELERDLVGRVGVDHRVDRAAPLVVGAGRHDAFPAARCARWRETQSAAGTPTASSHQASAPK